ncbi:MAG: hypothetical protein ACR2MZ_05225 [Candidatus Dormibacter sp.]|uniref:hypothetical protein n=1 Tax=Candidatus Dormibacter sp. TaxID=2973982 RepID=UPI000DB6A82A|nr:MAG: hypothetical protein DLM66_15405 [Candidatus Dormibacteraeota bacterium]
MTEESTGGAPQKAVQEKAQQAKEQALQVTSSAKEQLQLATGSAQEKMREQVNIRSTQAGNQVDSIGQAMRKASDHLSGQGNQLPAKAAEQLAQRVEQLGGYLRQSDADRILGDLENYARQQPLILATAGLVVGVAAARFLKTSSQRRYQQGKPSPEPGGSDDLAAGAALNEPAAGFAAIPPTRT